MRAGRSSLSSQLLAGLVGVLFLVLTAEAVLREEKETSLFLFDVVTLVLLALGLLLLRSRGRIANWFVVVGLSVQLVRVLFS